MHLTPRILDSTDSSRMVELGRSPRFLITRLSAIGDCVHAIPLVAAIRERYPNAFVGWVTQPKTAELLRDVPQLDALITVDRNWIKRPFSIPQLRQRLRDFHFDVTIDPQSLLKSSLLAWFSGAGSRIGFDGDLGREGSRRLNNQLVAPTSVHVIDRYLELLRPLGIMSPQASFPLSYSPEADRVVSSFMRKHGLTDFVILNPGAGWRSKLWPVERYAEVASRLSRQSMPVLVLWADQKEYAWAQEIADRCASAFVAPSTSLVELAAFCRRAQLFVGSDTGPTHLAAAVGTRCVGLYGPTRAEVCGPYGEHHVCVQGTQPNNLARSLRRQDQRAMLSIQVEQVTYAIDQALSDCPVSAGDRNWLERKPLCPNSV